MPMNDKEEELWTFTLNIKKKKAEMLVNHNTKFDWYLAPNCKNYLNL